MEKEKVIETIKKGNWVLIDDGPSNIKDIYKSKDIEEFFEVAVERNIPELVFLYGSELIKRNYIKEKYYLCELYDNMLKAALSLHLNKWATYYFRKLHEMFGKANGTRINLLQAIIHESTNRNDDALNIYEKLLEKNPGDILVRSKLINIKKKMEKDVNKIINLFNVHLHEFPTDTEAWHELGEIYLKNFCHKYALYCFEEILLYEPENLYNILTCAEINFTLNNLELSSKYFCLAIHNQPNNIRALWGIILVNYKRYVQTQKKIPKDNVDVILTNKCINTLKNIYEELNMCSALKETILQRLKKFSDRFN